MHPTRKANAPFRASRNATLAATAGSAGIAVGPRVGSVPPLMAGASGNDARNGSPVAIRRLVALEAAVGQGRVTVHRDTLAVAPIAGELTRKHATILKVASAESVSGPC